MGSKGTTAAQHATKAPRLKGVARATTASAATVPAVATGKPWINEGVSRAFSGVRMLLLFFSFLYCLKNAYGVRLLSVQIYGYLIHEFDPWFNYRAAEYMSTHGWSAFFSWFDYMSWYPLGRPVGSTTYPGLQLTAVAIHRALAAAGMPMSLNNVCVLMPAWFGAIATATMAGMTYEMSGSGITAAIAAFIFMILPAHLMRSMAGEFDNECIAVAAMLLTFYCWVRSLRTRSSWPIGVLTGVAYGYMVAAWGGYIFVLNMVAMHAGISSMVDWARNTYNPSLLRAYTLFYVVGTAIAVCVPPVGMSPFKSLEQLGALLVLVFLCGLQACEVFRARAGVEVRSRANFKIRVRVFSVMAGVAALAIAVLAPTGYFGPLSVRVRALFVEHTRTGNPLVDSVAEHQPAGPEAMWSFLHVCGVTWGLGSIVLALSTFVHYAPSKLFWLLNSGAVYYFSTRMARLLLLSGPAACLSTGIFVGTILEAAVQLSFWDSDATKARKQQKPAQGHRRGAGKDSDRDDAESATTARTLCDVFAGSPLAWGHRMVLFIAVWALVTTTAVSFFSSDFASHSTTFAEQSSNPMIVFAAVVQNRATGKPMNILVDDYLRSYIWLRDNTPEDARILAWWDYGYQITGIGNRTSLADGNTWNHEHIATIGKMLTSPVAEAHSLVRHMADYVLIFAGDTYFSDLNRSPHMARIGNSVYRDICPHDPLCSRFVLQKRPKAAAAKRSRHVSVDELEEEDNAEHVVYEPSSLMAKSLIYHLHSAGVVTGVTLNETLFQHVFTSAQGLIRIFKVMNVSEESKEWVADPANRVCHPPGSWICPGQYPPAKEIQEMLAHRVPFDQVEKVDRKNHVGLYHEEYMRRMRESES